MPAGLSPAEIDAYVVGAVAARRGPLPPVGRRAARPGPDPGGDPGPVRGLRGRRHHRRRRARPPRLPRRGAHRRPAHARGGARLGAAARARPPAARTAAAELVAVAAAADGRRAGAHVAGRPRPRVAVLEWTDPPYAPGHWIPEMVELAGGECVLGTAGPEVGPRSRWDDLHAARPDVVVVAPCGYDRAGAQAQAERCSPTACSRRRHRPRRRRRRHVGPARPAAGRRGRGAGRRATTDIGAALRGRMNEVARPDCVHAEPVLLQPLRS